MRSALNSLIFHIQSKGRNYESKVKVKQSHYRPGQALKFPEVCGSQISRQHMKVVRSAL
jgi:hypothetical protein